jgi:hypothetical protein
MKVEMYLSQTNLNGAVCDFCSGAPVHAAYDASNFETQAFRAQHVRQVSVGAWAACVTCSELIDGQRWEELVGRVVDSLIQKYPLLKRSREELERQFEATYAVLRRVMRKPN